MLPLSTLYVRFMEVSVLIFSASQTAYIQSSGENATLSRGISLLASYKFSPLRA